MESEFGSSGVFLLLVFCSSILPPSLAHIDMDTRQLTELKGICEVAYNCFHDQILVCGKSVNQARSFLDLCDMYEYACEYNIVFRHVKDEDHCPNEKELGIVG